MIKFNKTITQRGFFLSALIILSFTGIFSYEFYPRILFGLSSDELFSVGIATHILDNGIFPVEFKYLNQLDLNDTFLTWKAADQSPFLYETVLAIWLSILGDSDIHAKLLSLFFYVITVWFSYRYVIRDENILHQISFLSFILFSPVVIVFSVEARTYMMVFMFSTFLLYQLKQIVLTNGLHLESNKTLILNILLMLGMAFSHYYGFILAMISLMTYAYLIYRNKSFHKRYLLLLIIPVSVFLYITLFNKLGIEYASSGNLAWSAHMTYSDLIHAMFGSLYGVIGTTVLISILVSFLVTSKDKDLFFVLVFVIFFVYTVLYIFFTLKNGTYHIRHYIFILPFLFYALSYIAGKHYQFFLLILIILVIFFINTQNALAFGKEDYKKAGEFVSEQFRKSNGDSTIVTTWCPNQSFYFYYLKKVVAKDKVVCINTVDGFNNLNGFLHNTFIIESHIGHQPLIEAINKNNNFQCVNKPFENINVNICRKNK